MRAAMTPASKVGGDFFDGIALEVGNIRLSAFALARVGIFGSILFWLGKISIKAGQEAIRSRETLDGFLPGFI